MTKAPLRIDVVMATYNGARFLREQLDSIAVQTQRPAHLIIVDDCSTDNTWELLQQWAVDKSWVTLLRQPQNAGVNASFQRAWQASTADWVAFADQDDIWLADKLERLQPLLRDAELCYSDASVIDASGLELYVSEMHFHHSLPISGRSPGFFLLNNCVSGHNLIASRTLLERAVPVPADMLYDHWLALLASCGAGIRFLPETTCQHRMHSSNLTNNPAVRRQQRKKRDQLRVSAPVPDSSARWARIEAELESAGETTLLNWLRRMRSSSASNYQRFWHGIKIRKQLLPHFHGWQRWRRLWKLRRPLG